MELAMMNDINPPRDGFETTEMKSVSTNGLDGREETALQPHVRGHLYELEMSGSTPSSTHLPHSTPDENGRKQTEGSGRHSHSSLSLEELGESAVERAPSQPSRPPSPPNSKIDPVSNSQLLLLQLSTYSLLIFATIWGVLGRLGLEWIGGFANNQVFALIWPQMVGCVIMGFVVERKAMLEAM